jgi:hypothetical protein
VTDVGASDAATKRVQLLSTILLAVAAVTTAWCSYQAARWTAEYRAASGHTNAIRLEAARAQGLAEAETEVDVATFTQWVDAYALGRTKLADFYFKRFRKEFRPAVLAWLATKPLTNPEAPLTPFAMPQYKLTATKTARQLDADAELSSAKGRDNQRSTNYVLAVVLCASSLFFAGMSKVGGSLRQQEVLLAIGWALLLGTVIWVATSPVSVSV